jgi:hypothetical protein
MLETMGSGNGGWVPPFIFTFNIYIITVHSGDIKYFRRWYLFEFKPNLHLCKLTASTTPTHILYRLIVRCGEIVTGEKRGRSHERNR